MTDSPYTLVICSHKGGTGRTTAALGLAWSWGQAGLSVLLVDADPIHASSLVALDETGDCAWSNVRHRRGVPESFGQETVDLIIVDAPSLLEAEAQQILHTANGVVLTCLADPLSLRTIPAAANVIRHAREHNPQLDLLGILLGIYDNQDALQEAMVQQLRQRHGELLLEPPIPFQPEIREWPMSPGSELPAGPAADAFATVARGLENWIRTSVRV